MQQRVRDYLEWERSFPSYLCLTSLSQGLAQSAPPLLDGRDALVMHAFGNWVVLWSLSYEAEHRRGCVSFWEFIEMTSFAFCSREIREQLLDQDVHDVVDSLDMLFCFYQRVAEHLSSGLLRNSMIWVIRTDMGKITQLGDFESQNQNHYKSDFKMKNQLEIKCFWKSFLKSLLNFEFILYIIITFE